MSFKRVALIVSTLTLFLPLLVSAQELVPDKEAIAKAKVIEVINQEKEIVPGTKVETKLQTLKVEVLDGPEQGKIVTLKNDYVGLKTGEVFYVRHLTNELDGTDAYSVLDPYRLPTIFGFVVLFLIVLLFFGGYQGMRGLASLVFSICFICYILLPAILHGYSPLLISTGVSALIIILGSYVTHGFNRTTTAAVLGMIITIVITGVLSYIAVYSAQLSGFTSEEATYLNFDTQGNIDFVGLLLGGIMIGLLGVLYDASIGQAIAIEELKNAASHFTKRELYQRGIRIGREHIGALVNTLAIAYVGVSLPLLLLFSTSKNSIFITLNRELFATEIIRTMIGSIGLILAVPITTFIAIQLLHNHTPKKTSGSHHHH